MKIKNLLLISICLFSFGSFAGNTNVSFDKPEKRLFEAMLLYDKIRKGEIKKYSADQLEKLKKYSVDQFVISYINICKMKGDMIYALDVVYEDKNTPKELLQRAEAEAHKQGIIIPSLNRKK